MLSSHDDGNITFDPKVIYFYSMADKNPQATLDISCSKELQQLEKFKDKIEKKITSISDICIPRFYYFNDQQKIEIGNDADVQDMWKFFESSDKHKKVFFEFEDSFVFRIVKEDYKDAEKLLVEAKGERSYLFKATYKQKTVVIKITKGSQEEDPETDREIAKMMTLKHPNIVHYGRLINFHDKYHEDQFTKTYIGYHMPYYEQGDMSRISTPLSEMSILIIGLKMGSILLYLKQKKHVHRDIKLNNFLIRSKEERQGVIVYDLILADWERAYGFRSLVSNDVDTMESAVTKDINNFGECLEKLTKLACNCESKISYSTELTKLIQDITTTNLTNIQSILEKLTLMAFKLNPMLTLSFIDNSLASNEIFMEQLISLNPIALKCAHDDLKSKESFVNKILNIYPHCLKYVHDDLKGKFQFMAKYVRKDGLLLQYASDSLKRNPEFVKVAINETACAIMFVTEIFDGYTDLLKDCLNRNAFLLEFALVKTKDIVKCAISKDPLSICFAKEQEFVNDSDIQQIIEDYKMKEANLDQKTQTRFINWDNVTHKHRRNGFPVKGMSNSSNSSSSPVTPTPHGKKRYKIGEINVNQ